jgi:hypothetical protein
MPDMVSAIQKVRQLEERQLALVDEIRNLMAAPLLNADDINEKLRQIASLGRETLDCVDGLMTQFDKLKETMAETEEKLAQMREILDQLRSKVSSGDYDFSKTLCEQRYASVWPKLDETSKSFLITASYLCKKCVSESLDFSPMIVEMSRAYENELLVKIFRDFVNRNAQAAALPSAGGTDALFKAVNDAKSGRPFFISLTQMIKIMKRLQNDRNTYGGRLYTELNAGWDTSRLSDYSFYQNGITYANDYRNRAAHPGVTLDEADAADCEQLSQSLLDHFIGSMKS